MNLATSQDIISQGLRFAGEITDLLTSDNVSEYRPVALEYLNRAYLAVLSGGNEFDVEMAEPFSWSLEPQPGVFSLQPAITVLASLAHGSTAGTFAVPPVDAFGTSISVKNRYIRFSSFSDVYIITAHTAGQINFTVDLGYLQNTQVLGDATLFQLDYELAPASGILRLTTPMRLFQLQSTVFNGEIVGSNMAPMRREYPLAFLQVRYPDRFAIKSQDPTATNPSLVVQMNSTPLDVCRVEYDYVPYPTLLTDASSSLPIVPLQHRMVLAYAIAHYLCVDKNDNRSANYLQLLQAGFISMVKAEKKQRGDTNRERGRLIPRMDKMYTRRRAFWWGWG